MTRKGNGQRAIDGDSVLIVDDSAANLRLLWEMLRERGYRVRAVSSGLRALESVQAELPDLILLDIRMAEMTGFEVCERLKSDPRTRDIPVIFISALTEIEDKVRAFQVGGVDYVTKPFQVEEVLARLQTHLSLRRLQRQLEEANRKFARELALAGKVQCGFLPDDLPQPAGWQVAACLRPAHETSGDFYDVFHLPDGRLGLVIADVVDKGVGAALFMALSWSLLRTYACEFLGEPGRVFGAVNERLLEDAHADQFVTVFYGILDPSNGALAYCNAGQCPPLLFNENGGCQRLTTTGPPLGILEDVGWEQRSVTLPSDAVLALYTDGVTEAQTGWGDFFGMERLVDAIGGRRHLAATAIQAGIVGDVGRFAEGPSQTDDIAMIILVRRGLPTEERMMA